MFLSDLKVVDRIRLILTYSPIDHGSSTIIEFGFGAKSLYQQNIALQAIITSKHQQACHLVRKMCSSKVQKSKC